MKTYYETLGVSEEASQDEIKQAYRKLAIKLHPDKNSNDTFFDQLFKSINEAYEVIGDEKKRAAYNHTLRATKRGKTQNSPFETEDFDFLLVNATCLILVTRQVSSTGLQRNFKIGYGRAGRIIDQLEHLGIISPFDGHAPRKLLVSYDGALELLRKNIPGFSLPVFQSQFKSNQAAFKANASPVATTPPASPTIRKKNRKPASVWAKVTCWKWVKRFFLFANLLLVSIYFFRESLTNAKITATKGLKIRETPHVDAVPITGVPNNQRVEILRTDGPLEKIEGRKDNWYYIRYKNKEGWAWGGFIKRDSKEIR
ncbi:DnaJ domain-containing protein [Rufibacter sp. LB8]|uniref:DnaJ domain-containing protein n=1 Tax=Rufibacter sp. LB8 TaxID=2777781 RepID=UPI00178C4858|nr:DnaJ domain-containing protein [Rufibacter sp. LB8]